MFRDNTTSYPDDKKTLGLYIGTATGAGSAMWYKILRADGKISYRTTIHSLTLSERANPEQEKLRTDFDIHITDRLCAAATMEDFYTFDLTPQCVYYEDPDTAIHEGSPDEILPTPELGDNFVNMEIMLPRGDEMAIGQVTKQARESNGNPLGNANTNSILDTCQYIVGFADGDEAKLADNLIATNMYDQFDPNGNYYVIIYSIIDFSRSTTALCYADQKTTQKGRTYYQRSNAGWKLCCQWKDGSTSWMKLLDIKESHPIETAEYDVAQGIDGEPAFNWWVPHIIKKRAHIISLVKKRSAHYLKKTHKLVVEVPKSAKHALELDRRYDNTFWSEAISK